MTLIRSALFFAALLAAPASASTTWHVDASAPCPGLGSTGAPFCTIQAALDAASPGDQISVAPGLYAERLDFLGKDVSLTSALGPDVTIVDAGLLGSVVTFANGEGRDALIRGFTLRNGGDQFVPGSGGGIYCHNSSPTISGNVIELNFAQTGGGLALLGGSPLVTGNTVRDNLASFGAGIHCGQGTTAELLENSIVSNGQFGTTGGGIDVNGAAPLIEDNQIEENVSAGGAGISIESNLSVVVRGNLIRANGTNEGDGGGLLTSPNTLVEDNEIVENTAVEAGGGVWAFGGTFRNNHIAGNSSRTGSGVVAANGATFDGDRIEDNADSRFGGVVALGALPITLSRVVIRGNGQTGLSVIADIPVLLEDCLVADQDQGVVVDVSTQVTLRRCSFNGNTSWAVIALDGGHASLESCIAWGNGLGTGLELFADTGTIDATWSIVRLGYPGTGNLALDPLFANAPAGNYALLPGSPAIDSGDPADGVCGFDLAGTPRRLDGLLDVGSEVDRGALEFDNGHLATSVPMPSVLRIELTGTPGLPARLFASLSPGQLRLEKWGSFGLDLSGIWIVVVWPSAPSTINAHIAPALSGLPVVLQALVGPPGFATGNLTNAVSVTLP